MTPDYPPISFWWSLVAALLGVALLLWGTILPFLVAWLDRDGDRRENAGTEQGRWDA